MRRSSRVLGVAALGCAAVLLLTAFVSPPDQAALRRSISSLPDQAVTAAQVRVDGSTGAWAGRAGVRDLESGRPVPARGRFRIASATKMFTAVVVLQLAAERRLDLRATVQHYLPGVLPRSYPPITVRQLLDHTSGLPSSTEDAGSDDPAWVVAHRFDSYTPRQVVASATKHPMMFRPGSAQHYNGVNYFLAGMLVEKVTSRDYGHELERRVLRPLGLRDTYLPRPGDFSISGPHAHGYVRVDGVPVDVTAQSPYGWAESGLISTTADLGRFMKALFGGRLLTRAQQAVLFAVPDVPYSGGTCPGGGSDGRACFSAGLTRTRLPNGIVVWGKSGGLAGYTTAAFATRDLRRVLTYSLSTTGNRDGSEGERVQRIVTATFLTPPEPAEDREGSAGRARER